MTEIVFRVFDRDGAFIGMVQVRTDGRANVNLPRGVQLGRFNNPDAAVRAIHEAKLVQVAPVSGGDHE